MPVADKYIFRNHVDCPVGIVIACFPHAQSRFFPSSNRSPHIINCLFFFSKMILILHLICKKLCFITPPAALIGLPNIKHHPSPHKGIDLKTSHISSIRSNTILWTSDDACFLTTNHPHWAIRFQGSLRWVFHQTEDILPVISPDGGPRLVAQ